MKHYLYVSKTKIDMLYPQILKTILENIDDESNINAGFSNTLTANPDSGKTLYDKLDLISSFLEKEGSIGTVDSPKQYFKGILPMRWGSYGWDEKSQLVYFGGFTDAGTVLGLGGSMDHVLEKEKLSSHANPNSLPFAIANKLSVELNIPLIPGDKYEIEGQRRAFALNDESYLEAALLATDQMEGPLQNLEFLAEKLIAGGGDDRRVVLGTPIYVAVAG
ncbi:DUF7019 family protein [Candidatus Nitrosocosmicus sp. R]